MIVNTIHDLEDLMEDRTPNPLGRWMSGYLEKGIQPPMTQGRSTNIIAIIKWIRTSRLSINKSL